MNKDLSMQHCCPVCRSKNVEEYIHTKLSTFFFPLPENLVRKAKPEPIKLNICNNCSFIFQVDVKNHLIELIYNEFYKHYNLDTSVEFQEVYRERTIDFMNEVVPNELIDSKALDLGCGEGTYFPFFEKLGFECYGIEPSEKAKIAKLKNPNSTISYKFFSDLEPDELDFKFDVILMNWVLEHILGLDSLFDKLIMRLNNKGRLIIQVPDIEYYFNNDLPLFYVHEHINYFTLETLEVLLKNKGFKIIGTKVGDCPSILVCAEYTGIVEEQNFNNTNLVSKQKSFHLSNNELKADIIKSISKYENIVFYGTGLLAYWIGSMCINEKDMHKVELIDDNEFYQNKFTTVFLKKIKEFPIGHCFDNTLIIIGASPVYHDKIKGIINKKYVGNYKVASVKNNSLTIE